jgi:hypothetical protein
MAWCSSSDHCIVRPMFRRREVSRRSAIGPVGAPAEVHHSLGEDFERTVADGRQGHCRASPPVSHWARSSRRLSGNASIMSIASRRRTSSSRVIGMSLLFTAERRDWMRCGSRVARPEHGAERARDRWCSCRRRGRSSRQMARLRFGPSLRP